MTYTDICSLRNCANQPFIKDGEPNFTKDDADYIDDDGVLIYLS